MGNFMKKMKSAAEQAKVKDHPLFTREYSTEIRNAYFSGAAASLCFLDDELDPEEQHALALLGQSLHLSADEISEGLKTVQDVGEDDKMEFLQEVFALMDSDYLKYALLTDIHTLCLKKGQLTEDEKDFINTSAEILFGEEKNVFELWEKGLTLDNAEKFSVKDDDNSSKNNLHAAVSQNSEREKMLINDEIVATEENIIMKLDQMDKEEEEFVVVSNERGDLFIQSCCDNGNYILEYRKDNKLFSTTCKNLKQIRNAMLKFCRQDFSFVDEHNWILVE